MPDNAVVTAKNVDLSNCDREQIQFSAATLSNGFLLVLQEPELTIIQAGENASGFLSCSPDQVLGRPVESVLGPVFFPLLQQRIAGNQLDGPPVHVCPLMIGENAFDLFVHRCAGSLIAEFEDRETNAPGQDQDIYSRVHASIARLQRAPTLQKLLNLAVTEIRGLTGFDRVMAYKFLDDGSGWVSAESVSAGWEPFLGLHFPPTDIPLPARRLFKLTWLRHLPDVGYTAVPIVPETNPVTGQPLDLSFALLRSVSVMYSQYLKNMGTRASMVMTLLKNGELWGLIACHHHSGHRHVRFEHRAACEYVAHMVSLLLSTKDDQEDFAYRVKLQETHAQMISKLAVTGDFLNALVDRRPGLLDFIDAGGAALIRDGVPTLLGSTPAEEQVRNLAEWLAASGDRRVYSTDSLSSEYPAAAPYAGVASGLLAIRTAGVRNDYILWFRPEFQRTVNWAGDPQKPVDISDDGQRLLPRTSFAIWKETVREKSRPWKPVELKAAADLQVSLFELAARKVEQLDLLNRNLQRTNADLDSFAYIASHDLKEPLRGIHNYSQFVLEDVGDALPPESADRLRTVVRLTRRMDSLLDSLLDYARLGRQGLNVTLCDVNRIVADSLDTLALRIQEAGAEVRVLEPLPPVSADYVRLIDVFTNLVGNALKYNDKDHKLIEIGCDCRDGETLFFVRDNGIGIAPEFRETIFAIFRRLHAPERFGGGTGAGLTITRKIVERHEGRIWVESTPGEGSTFYFTIGIE